MPWSSSGGRASASPSSSRPPLTSAIPSEHQMTVTKVKLEFNNPYYKTKWHKSVPSPVSKCTGGACTDMSCWFSETSLRKWACEDPRRISPISSMVKLLMRKSLQLPRSSPLRLRQRGETFSHIKLRTLAVHANVQMSIRLYAGLFEYLPKKRVFLLLEWFCRNERFRRKTDNLYRLKKNKDEDEVIP